MSGQKTEDIFQVSTINKNRKVAITASLKDENGNVIEIKEVIEKLLQYMEDNLSTDAKNNGLLDQILPVMAAVVGNAIPKLAGPELSASLFSHPGLRHTITCLPILGFLLLKFIQQHKLKIYTVETNLSNEELQRVQDMDTIASASIRAILAGINPQVIIEELRRQGILTDEALSHITTTNNEESDPKTAN